MMEEPAEAGTKRREAVVIVLEVLGGLVLLILGLSATWMAIVGLMGACGAARLTRCRECGHLHVAAPRGQQSVCLYCHHPWVTRHMVPVRVHHFLPAEMEPLPSRTGAHSPAAR